MPMMTRSRQPVASIIHGDPPMVEPEVRQLAAQKVSESEIARGLSIGRTSVRRILRAKPKALRRFGPKFVGSPVCYRNPDSGPPEGAASRASNAPRQ